MSTQPDHLTPGQVEWYKKVNRHPLRVPWLIVDGVVSSLKHTYSAAEGPVAETVKNFKTARQLRNK